MGRKIDDEEAAVGKGKRGKKDKKKGTVMEEEPRSTMEEQTGGQVGAGAVAGGEGDMVEPDMNRPDAPAVDSLFPTKPTYGATSTAIEVDPTPRGTIDTEIDTDTDTITVPRKNPLQQGQVPPEIVFFGEPRNPPPGEAAKDTRYHGSLLYWARHATVAPRTSEERLTTVFPRGRLHPQSPKFRLGGGGDSLSYASILDTFASVMDDLEATKAFLNANIDLVPSKLFLRVITADKLAAQSRGDLERMDTLKEIRRRYILAHDQVFFPLNIEVQKAETRVMTYLARPELQQFAQSWDEVEMTLHFTTLLAARLTWDQRVKDILDDIKQRVEESVGYMAEGLEKDLMSRDFRKPGITSELYLNASNAIATTMPELLARVRPEVRLLHEVYFMTTEDCVEYVQKVFCPKTGLSPDQVREKLRIYEASLAAVQGVDYINLRLLVQQIHRSLCSEEDLRNTDKWYFDFVADGYKFATYEPDEVPALLRYEQRLRDTGNAFSNFAVEVLKGPTKYTESFSGRRPKASQVGDWLRDDPDFVVPQPAAYEERVEQFRDAYIAQTEERKKAESRLTMLVRNRMDQQDKVLYRLNPKPQPQFDAESAALGADSMLEFEGEE